MSDALQQELPQVGIELQAALRSNIHESRASIWVKLLKRMWRLIERSLVSWLSDSRLKKSGNETCGT